MHINYRKCKQYRKAKNKVHSHSVPRPNPLPYKCLQEEFDLPFQHISLVYE